MAELAVGFAIVGALIGITAGLIGGGLACGAGCAVIGGIVGGVIGALVGATFAYGWALAASEGLVGGVEAGAASLLASSPLVATLIGVGRLAFQLVGRATTTSAREAIKDGVRIGAKRPIQQALRDGAKTTAETAVKRMKGGTNALLPPGLVEQQREADEVSGDVRAVPGGDLVMLSYLGTLVYLLGDPQPPTVRRGVEALLELFARSNGDLAAE